MYNKLLLCIALYAFYNHTLQSSACPTLKSHAAQQVWKDCYYGKHQTEQTTCKSHHCFAICSAIAQLADEAYALPNKAYEKKFAPYVFGENIGHNGRWKKGCQWRNRQCFLRGLKRAQKAS